MASEFDTLPTLPLNGLEFYFVVYSNGEAHFDFKIFEFESIDVETNKGHNPRLVLTGSVKYDGTSRWEPIGYLEFGFERQIKDLSEVLIACHKHAISAMDCEASSK